MMDYAERAVPSPRTPRKGGSPGSSSVKRSGAVVVSTGKYRLPCLPSWPGAETFGGTIVHSADYRCGAPYAGMRVLVVGTPKRRRGRSRRTSSSREQPASRLPSERRRRSPRGRSWASGSAARNPACAVSTETGRSTRRGCAVVLQRRPERVRDRPGSLGPVHRLATACHRCRFSGAAQAPKDRLCCWVRADSRRRLEWALIGLPHP